jgi:hypothetical protein
VLQLLEKGTMLQLLEKEPCCNYLNGALASMSVKQASWSKGFDSLADSNAVLMSFLPASSVRPPSFPHLRLVASTPP